MGAYGQSGQRYCVLCALNIKIDEEPDEWEDLGDEANGKVIGNFQSTFSVKPDKETGQIVGWDEFFKHVEKSAAITDIKDELSQKVLAKMKATYVIKLATPPTYVLNNTQTGETHNVTVV